MSQNAPRTNRRRNIWFAVCGIGLAVNALIGFQVYSKESERSGEDEAFEKVRVMMHVMHLIRQNYVDAEKAEPDKLIHHAMKGMVDSLDPFSSFLDPNEYSDMMESTEGQFGGLGIVVTIRDGLLTVVTPMEGGPGLKAGLRAGDQIVEIEGVSTRELELSECVKRLKGEPGTEVNIAVYRPDTEKKWDVTVKREIIKVPSVKHAKVLEEEIGYLRITQFSDPTAEKLAGTLKELVEKDIKGLIIDVRNNPGGLLESAVEVSGLFLEEEKLVVFTEGRRPSQKREYHTEDGEKLPEKIHIAILVNGGTASAAEILAGCLQDYGRAILIGEKTFGKGSVQNVISLPDDSALRLTTAKYYTPSKRIIHERGIEPDIHVPISDEEHEKLAKQLEEMMREGKQEVLMDSQVRRAIETLKSYDAYVEAQRARFSKIRESDKTDE